MNPKHVIIRAIGAVSAVRNTTTTYGENAQPPSFMELHLSKGVVHAPVYRIHQESEASLKSLNAERKWDRAALLGVMSATDAFQRAGWSNANSENLAVIMGSSRGSVNTYEEALQTFLQGNLLPTHISPVTTMGSFATSVAETLGLYGEALDCSMTCSSGLIAIRSAIAGILSGFYERALCGGAESALTEFTAAQMQPLGICTEFYKDGPPCQPLNTDARHNLMCLGEGAAVVALEGVDVLKAGNVCILGSGVGREAAPSYTGVTSTGEAIQLAITKALADAKVRYGILKNDISFILPHAPGTKKGDSSEMKALSEIFEDFIPPLFSTKWLTGHTFGAAGVLSLELALHLISGGRIVPTPYRSLLAPKHSLNSLSPRVALIIGAGFGGSATVLVVGVV